MVLFFPLLCTLGYPLNGAMNDAYAPQHLLIGSSHAQPGVIVPHCPLSILRLHTSHIPPRPPLLFILLVLVFTPSQPELESALPSSSRSCSCSSSPLSFFLSSCPSPPFRAHEGPGHASTSANTQIYIHLHLHVVSAARRQYDYDYGDGCSIQAVPISRRNMYFIVIQAAQGHVSLVHSLGCSTRSAPPNLPPSH